tara:strand:+ start:29 stop:265 length:237 start_codon:yes stop_codon:yes gene_type:complete
MELLTKKILALNESGITEEYTKELLGLINHERRTSAMNFKNFLNDMLKDSEEFKAFKVMDESCMDRIIDKAKREWLSL